MRLFKIFVLLLISGTAFGQSGAAMLMTSAAAAPVVDTFLLDSFPSAAAAYSLRCLKYDQLDSAAIRVRRTSDNAEQDIGFTSQGYLDTASLKTFVGANDGRVVKWYDLSGDEYDLSQTTAINQGAIMISGTVQRINSRPAIRFDGGDYLENTTGFTVSSNVSFFMTNKPITAPNVADGSYLEVFADASNGVAFGCRDGGFYTRIRKSSSNTTGNGYDLSSTATNLSSNIILWSTPSNTYYHNGTSRTDANLQRSINNPGIRLGSAYSVGTVDNYISEFIIYQSDQSANRTAIEENLNNHYSIY